MIDINIQLIDFKNSKAKETVVYNEDGSYTIFINSRISKEQQLNAYQHALNHINRSDFEHTTSADTTEAYAHFKEVSNEKKTI